MQAVTRHFLCMLLSQLQSLRMLAITGTLFLLNLASDAQPAQARPPFPIAHARSPRLAMHSCSECSLCAEMWARVPQFHSLCAQGPSRVLMGAGSDWSLCSTIQQAAWHVTEAIAHGVFALLTRVCDIIAWCT